MFPSGLHVFSLFRQLSHVEELLCVCIHTARVVNCCDTMPSSCTLNIENPFAWSPSLQSISLPLKEQRHSVLPPLLALMLMFLRAAAVWWPFRTTMLLGFLQKLVQTKWILLKLNWSISAPASGVTIRVGKLFVRNKPVGEDDTRLTIFKVLIKNIS